jgi:predicted metal-binding protein
VLLAVHSAKCATTAYVRRLALGRGCSGTGYSNRPKPGGKYQATQAAHFAGCAAAYLPACHKEQRAPEGAWPIRSDLGATLCKVWRTPGRPIAA